MSVVQTYILNAKAGKEGDLESAASRLADAVRPLPGCEGVIVLKDTKNTRRFIFMETYVDAASHKAAGERLPKDIMTDLMGALDGAPDVSTCSYLKRL